MYKDFLKPFLDFSFALGCIILFSPIILSITLLLLVVNRGNPFFIQKRPGRNEKIFKVVKFKTMNDRKDREGKLLPDDERLTPVGRFIRKTSLDELPQLFNVLVGHMSFVGPRPLLIEYLPLYNVRQRLRHHVKPGITGWAQVNGRNAISHEEKFELDVWYVEHLNLRLDCVILLKTIGNILKSKDINHPGNATMPKFTGNKKVEVAHQNAAV